MIIQGVGKPLHTLVPGQGGTVLSIDSGSLASRRLRELGFVAGTPVRLVRKAPLGDPLELDVAGYRLSLRSEHAACVDVSTD